MQYEVNGWTKLAEEDSYTEGCLTETAQMFDGNDRFTAPTEKEIIKKLQEFCCVDENEGNTILNSCDEPGRIDIQAMETGEGYRATPNQIEQWKKGEMRLWAVTYSFQVELVERKQVSLANGEMVYV